MSEVPVGDRHEGEVPVGDRHEGEVPVGDRHQGEVPVGDRHEGEVPVWRRDFPYSSAGEDDVTRREFVRFLMVGSGSFAVGTAAVAGITSLRGEPSGGDEEVVEVAALQVAEPHLFRYPTADDPAVLLLRPDGSLVAFSQKCTHLGCVVYLDEAGAELVCPCHEGGFSADTGAVLFGPPERPLPRIAVEVRDGTVWATGIDDG